MNFNRDTFFSSYRAAFGALRQQQVDGLTALLDVIERQTVITDVRQISYCFATTKHETGDTFQPVEEWGKGKGRPYGVPAGPWHKVYDGRGDVQLTWERNYIFATQRLHELGVLLSDESLHSNPELAMRPDVAAAVMIYGMAEGWFTHFRLSDFIGAHGCNYVAARHIINGTDKAELIAAYATRFEKILRASVIAPEVQA